MTGFYYKKSSATYITEGFVNYYSGRNSAFLSLNMQ